MADQASNDATNGEEKKKAEAITIRVKDQVCVSPGWSLDLLG